MDEIGATRVSSGQTVELSVADDVLSARTPDGEVIQSQPVAASALEIRSGTLTWSGVDYTVDDHEAARSFVEALTPPPRPRRRRRRILAGTMIFVFGLLLGAVVGVVVRDRMRDADCDEARAVVDRSVATMAELNETDSQDRSFYAAVIVEQRAITFAMEARPSCFSFAERAAAHGLLEGIRGLLTTASG